MKKLRLIKVLKFLANGLWYLHWAALVFITFMTFVGSLNLFDFGPKVSIPVHFKLAEQGQVAFESGPLPVAINFAEGIIRLDHPVPLNIIIPGYLITLIFLALGLFIMYQLKTILKNISLGEPFSESNTIMIRNMGFAIILTWIIENLLHPIITLILMPKLQFESIDLLFRWAPDFNLLLVGFLLLALGQIFRIGFEMNEEQKLTV